MTERCSSFVRIYLRLLRPGLEQEGEYSHEREYEHEYKYDHKHEYEPNSERSIKDVSRRNSMIFPPAHIRDSNAFFN